MRPLSEHPESSSRRRSSLTTRLTSLPLAVVLWMLSVCGLALHEQARVERQEEQVAATFDVPGVPWEWTLGGTVLLLVAALLWAMLTAWSSMGTTVVGIATVAAGVAIATHTVRVWVIGWTDGLDWGVRRLVPMLLTSGGLTILGSMLLAVGLGTALARRRR